MTVTHHKKKWGSSLSPGPSPSVDSTHLKKNGVDHRRLVLVHQMTVHIFKKKLGSSPSPGACPSDDSHIIKKWGGSLSPGACPSDNSTHL